MLARKKCLKICCQLKDQKFCKFNCTFISIDSFNFWSRVCEHILKKITVLIVSEEKGTKIALILSPRYIKNIYNVTTKIWTASNIFERYFSFRTQMSPLYVSVNLIIRNSHLKTIKFFVCRSKTKVRRTLLTFLVFVVRRHDIFMSSISLWITKKVEICDLPITNMLSLIKLGVKSNLNS